MSAENLHAQSTQLLVSRFKTYAQQQDERLLFDDTTGYNNIYRKMDAISRELKGRTNDQRRALAPLMDDANPQVQLKAAIACITVAPTKARAVLQKLISNPNLPQALNAGMFLKAVDEGKFSPS